MVLPLPQILESRLPLSPGPRQSLLLFQELVARCEPALKTELRFQKAPKVKFEFPQLVASWLVSALQRSRLTAWGAIGAINAPNEVLFVLAVRALLEVAALVAHVHDKLIQVYDGRLSRSDMTCFALRMKFATRKPDDMELNEREVELTKAINVLTAMKNLDRFCCRHFGFQSKAPMSNWYARLCEWCHPNGLGMSVGSEVDLARGYERFETEPTIHAAVLETFAGYLYCAQLSCLLLYNKCWDYLMQHDETLPQWKPDDDPQVDISSDPPAPAIGDP